MKYFTYDIKKYPEFNKMLESLDKNSRKVVLIIDPHIKVVINY